MMMDIARVGLRDHKARVILVEDDPAVRRSLQLLFLAHGFEVRAYASGTALLADSAAMDAACLVADYQMAECDGIDTLVRLRRLGWTGRAILMTGYPSAGITIAARGAGFDAIFEKPLRQHEIVKSVARLVHDHGPD